MVEPVTSTRQALLVRCFAEFDVLPDLLARLPPKSKEADAEIVHAWARVLDEVGYNIDHVEDDELPDGVSLRAFLARDALDFCRRIGLITGLGELSDRGVSIARMGDIPYRERAGAGLREVTRILAQQTQRNFLGADGLPLTDLLQGASAALASHGRIWPPELGGLLLSEVDTLLHWGALDSAKAERIARRDLLSIREREYRDMDLWDVSEVSDVAVMYVGADIEDAFDARDEHAFATRIQATHESDPELAQGSPLTTTGLRATAMALVHAQLLSLGGTMMGPQLLRPWEPLDDAR